jgi:hypothetical protein
MPADETSQFTKTASGGKPVAGAIRAAATL